jgi:hypothetical protein
MRKKFCKAKGQRRLAENRSGSRQRDDPALSPLF